MPFSCLSFFEKLSTASCNCFCNNSTVLSPEIFFLSVVSCIFSIVEPGFFITSGNTLDDIVSVNSCTACWLGKIPESNACCATSAEACFVSFSISLCNVSSITFSIPTSVALLPACFL